MEIVCADWVLTTHGLQKDWSVAFDSNGIVGLGPADRHPTPTVRLPGQVLIPGLVNAHSHAFQRSIRGHVQWAHTGNDDFWTWRTSMYETANRLTPEMLFNVSRLAFLEMVEAGITHVGEFHYLHHEPDGTRYQEPDLLAHRVIDAALDVGLRITLLRSVYARNGEQPLGVLQRRFGDQSPDEPLAAVGRLSAHADDRVSVGLAPHSVRAVPPSWLRELSSWGGVIHAHVAEQPAEVALAEREHGASPLQALATAGLVHDRMTAIHMTFPSPGDVEVLVDAGARVCACPTTEMDLGDGFLPMDIRRRVPMCLGSDSHAVIDLFSEARALEMHARALAGRRNVLAVPGDRSSLGRRLLDAATVTGAQALGRSGGGIAVGEPADFCAVDLRRTAALGVPPLECVVFNAAANWVSNVWVAGRRVVAAGHHPRREEILAAARPYMGV